MKWSRLVTIVAIAAAGSAPLPAYPAVAVGGVRLYAGYGSSDMSAAAIAFGTDLDVDLRAAVGPWWYLASWYHGELWLTPQNLVPSDQSDLGVLAGGPAGPFDVEARIATAVSSPLSDGRLVVEPQWSIDASLGILDSVDATARYAGYLLIDDQGTGDGLENRASLTVSYDPTVSVGVFGGPGASVYSFFEQRVLDAAGDPTTAQRRDIAATLRAGFVGIVGYFSTWSVEATGSLVVSNANRFVVATAALDESSEDRYGVDLAWSLESNPAASIGITTAVTGSVSWYTARDALDGAGLPTGEIARVTRATATVGFDWTPNGTLYLVAAGDAGWATSNDPALAGWGVSARLGIEVSL